MGYFFRVTILPLEHITARYLCLDPASGKKEVVRATRARAALVVIGVDALQRAFVLHTWAKRASTNGIVEAFLDACERWTPLVAAYEAAGQQDLLYDPIIDKATDRNLIVPLHRLKVSPGVDKNFRIRTTIQPWWNDGRLLIGEDQHELISEILTFPMAPQKDLVDALSGALSLVPPHQQDVSDDTEEEELARYLRETGVPPREIERRMHEVKGTVPVKFDFWNRLYQKQRMPQA